MQNNKLGKNQSSLGSSVLEAPPEYEDMLRQYEKNIRQHIQAEQQLHLHLEVLMDKYERTEKERDKEKVEMEQKFMKLSLQFAAI